MGWLRWLECFGLLTPNTLTKVEKVPEQYLKPQGLYPSSERIDLKKLRKLIIDGRLVACYPGLEESNPASCDEAEECPICMLMYPVLNTSRCCAKRLCTECFLQFCGGRSEESKNEEKLAEQNVIEARIREREEEVRRDEERILARSLLPPQPSPPPAVAPAVLAAAAAVPVVRSPARGRHNSPATASHHPHSGHRRRTSGNVGSRSDSPGTPSRHGLHGSPSRHVAHDNRGTGATLAHGTHAAHAEGGVAGALAGFASAEQASQSPRRFRLADYIPTGVVDIAVSVEDINAYMLEQAMYDSIAAAAADAATVAAAIQESTASPQSTARDSPHRHASPATAQRRRQSRLSSSRSAAMQDTSAMLAALLPLALQAAGMNQTPSASATTTTTTTAPATLHDTDHDASTSPTATASTTAPNSEPLAGLPVMTVTTSVSQTSGATPAGDDSDMLLQSNRLSSRVERLRQHFSHVPQAAPAVPASGTDSPQPPPVRPSSDCPSSDGFSVLLTLPASPASDAALGSPTLRPDASHPSSSAEAATAAVAAAAAAGPSPSTADPNPTPAPQSKPAVHVAEQTCGHPPSSPTPTSESPLLVTDIKPSGALTPKPTASQPLEVVCIAPPPFESSSRQDQHTNAAFLLSSSESISSVVFPFPGRTSSSAAGSSLTTSKSHTHRAPPPPPAGTPPFRSSSSSAAGIAAMTQPSSPLDHLLFSEPSSTHSAEAQSAQGQSAKAQSAQAQSDVPSFAQAEDVTEDDEPSVRNSLKTIAGLLALQGTPSLQERTPYIGMVLQVMTSVYHPNTSAAVAGPASHAGVHSGSSSSSHSSGSKQHVSHADDSSREPPARAFLENPDGSVYIISCPVLVAAQAATAKAACMQASTATADMSEHLLRAAVEAATYSDAAAQPYSLGAGFPESAAYADADVRSYSPAATERSDQGVRGLEELAANSVYADYSLLDAETGGSDAYSMTGRGITPTDSGEAWNAMSTHMMNIDRSLVASMAASDAQMAAALAAQDAEASSRGTWPYSTGGQQHQQDNSDYALVDRLAAADARLQAGFLANRSQTHPILNS